MMDTEPANQQGQNTGCELAAIPIETSHLSNAAFGANLGPGIDFSTAIPAEFGSFVVHSLHISDEDGAKFSRTYSAFKHKMSNVFLFNHAGII